MLHGSQPELVGVVDQARPAEPGGGPRDEQGIEVVGMIDVGPGRDGRREQLDLVHGIPEEVGQEPPDGVPPDRPGEPRREGPPAVLRPVEACPEALRQARRVTGPQYLHALPGLRARHPRLGPGDNRDIPARAPEDLGFLLDPGVVPELVPDDHEHGFWHWPPGSPAWTGARANIAPTGPGPDTSSPGGLPLESALPVGSVIDPDLARF